MPRTDRKWDIVLQTSDRKEGFKLLRARGQDRSVQGSWGPAELQVETARSRDVPVIWTDFSQGMGYSETWGPQTNGYAYGQNVYTRSPRLVLPAGYLYSITMGSFTTSGPVTDSEFFDGLLYFVAGERLMSLDPTSSAVSTVGIFSGSNFNKMTAFRGTGARRLYISDRNGTMLRRSPGGSVEAGSVGGFYRIPNPGTPPQLRFDDFVQVYWAVGDKRGYQLVAVSTLDPNGNNANGTYLYHCAGNPELVADWSPIGTIGEGFPVRSLAASNRRVYFCCDDGVYDVDDQGYAPNLTPYWKDYAHASNGQWSTVYSGMVVASHQLGLDWVPVGRGIRIDASTFAHPGSGLPNETPVYGPVTSGVNDGGWLAVAQFNGRDTYISYGKPRDMLGYDGPGIFVWHNELYIPGVKVTHMTIQNRNGGPMLVLFGHLYNDAGSTYNLRIYEVTLPTASTPLQDWLNGGRMRFAEKFSLFLPMEDWRDPASRKNLMRFDVQADQLGVLQGGLGTVQLELLAKVEAQEFKSQGTTAITPRGTIYPNNKYLDGYRIGMRVDGYGYTTKGTNNIYPGPSSETYPPILRAMKARAGLVVEQRNTRVYRIILGSGQMNDLAYDDRTHDLEKWLYSLQDYGPITMVDENGETLTAKIETGTTYTEVANPRSNEQITVCEIIATIIEEIALPVPQVTGYTGPRWDGGGEWGQTGVTDPDDITWRE